MEFGLTLARILDDVWRSSEPRRTAATDPGQDVILRLAIIEHAGMAARFERPEQQVRNGAAPVASLIDPVDGR